MFQFATRQSPTRVPVRLLAAGNLGWVDASLWLVSGAGLVLSPLGLGWVLLQAATVFVLAGLEWAGSNRAPGAALA